MEEQNKTTESGQAAADLDKSLARLETATRLTGLVVELQKAAANLEAYAASLLGLLAIDTSPLSYRKLDLTTIRRLITILGGPDPYATHHEGRHRVEDCITRDIHDYRHYLETIQLKDCGK